MAEMFNVPARATDSDGNPLSGAKIYFYLTGTTTPQAVYTDPTLATPLANPVVADSVGRFAAMYLDPAKSYRALGETSDGSVELFDVDPIDSGALSDLVASGGSDLIGFIQSGTGAVERTAQDKLRDTMSTADKGTDLKTALDSIATDYAAGGTANIPVGTHSLASTFTFTGDRLNTVGAGKLATIIQFDPASADVAFEINKPGAGGSFQGSFKGIGFYSTNSVDKTAIRLYNQANYEIADIAISTGGWLGDSIGIQTLGRQSLHLHNSEIVCARPVVHSVNPEHATIAVDHFLLEHLELIGTSATRPVVELEDGVVLSNYTLRNVAIVRGKDGVLWEDTTSTGVSYSALFENIRTEQALDSAAYSFRLGSTAQSFQSVSFRNIYLDSGRNGIRLRNAQSITLDSVVFAMSSGTALDVTFIAGTVLVMKNCRFVGGAITLTNAKLAFSSQLGASSPSQRGAFEVWVYQDPADLQDPKVGAVKFDGIITSSDYTLADGDTIELSTNEFTGNVFIDNNIGTGATIYLAGGNNVVSERDDPYGHYTVTVGSVGYTNVYWNAGTSRYRLQNLTGGSRTYTITKIGRGV